MKDPQNELDEAELRRQKPAAGPPELMARLIRARPPRSSRSPEQTQSTITFWILLRTWLVPAMALVIGLLLVWRVALPSRPAAARQPTPAASAAVKADDVQIQRELVSSFDTVVPLPSGEPVRYRCREWLDDVILRDKSQGMVVERRAPRVEVVPVRFEIY